MASQVGSSAWLTKFQTSHPRFLRDRFCLTSGSRNLRLRSNESRKVLATGLKWANNDFPSVRLNKAAKLYTDLGRLVQRRGNDVLLEPLRAKPGFDSEPIEMVEDGKMESSPSSKPWMASLHWPVARLVLIACLMFPFFLVENAVNMSTERINYVPFAEAAFYGSLAALLAITDRAEIPSLQSIAKRWSLPIGPRRYVLSAFLTMTLKFVAPVYMLMMLCNHWNEVGNSALFAITPFLAGCFVQFVCDVYLKVRGSSRWPPVLIILQVYRLYQLTKAAHFIQRLHEGFASTPEVSSALASFRAMFQVMGVVCLWALVRSILRLFPDRPVAES